MSYVVARGIDGERTILLRAIKTTIQRTICFFPFVITFSHSSSLLPILTRAIDLAFNRPRSAALPRSRHRDNPIPKKVYRATSSNVCTRPLIPLEYFRVQQKCGDLRMATMSFFTPWTCRSCLRQTPIPKSAPFRPHQQFNSYATQTTLKPKKRRRLLYTSAAGLGIVSTAVAFNDDAKHIAGGARRTGRVVGTLVLNINEYGLHN